VRGESVRRNQMKYTTNSSNTKCLEFFHKEMASCREFLAFKRLRSLCEWSIHKTTPIFILTAEDGTKYLPISSACYLLGKARQARNRGQSGG